MGIVNYLKGWVSDVFGGGVGGSKLGPVTSPAATGTGVAAVIWAAATYTRNSIDPHVQSLGKQVDDFFRKAGYIERKANEAEETLNKIKNLIDRLNRFREEETISEEGVLKKEVAVQGDRVVETIGVAEHPTWIPHFNPNEPWQYLFSDISTAIIGVLALIPTGAVTGITGWRIWKRRKRRKEFVKINKEMTKEIDKRLGPVKKEIEDLMKLVAGSNEVMIKVMKEMERIFENANKLSRIVLSLGSKGKLGGDIPESDKTVQRINALSASYDESIQRLKDEVSRLERICLSVPRRVGGALEKAKLDDAVSSEWKF